MLAKSIEWKALFLVVGEYLVSDSSAPVYKYACDDLGYAIHLQLYIPFLLTAKVELFPNFLKSL